MPQGHKLTDEDKARMRQLRAEGLTTREIGMRLGVNCSTVVYHTSPESNAKQKKQQLEKYQNNKEQKQAWQREYGRKNMGRILERRNATLVRRVTHRLSNKVPDCITADIVMAAYSRQKHKCAVCGVHESTQTKALSIDHCHNTDQFRGLLCGQCNMGMGHLGDTMDCVDTAAKYLADFEAGKFIRERCLKVSA